jgi:hypothetical protein
MTVQAGAYNTTGQADSWQFEVNRVAVKTKDTYSEKPYQKIYSLDS